LVAEDTAAQSLEADPLHSTCVGAMVATVELAELAVSGAWAHRWLWRDARDPGDIDTMIGRSPRMGAALRRGRVPRAVVQAMARAAIR
jgi:hypothetical protein